MKFAKCAKIKVAFERKSNFFSAFFFFFRHFAASNPRSFTARYDAYTQSIELLDSKAQIMKNMRQINRELRTLTDAMDKLTGGD